MIDYEASNDKMLVLEDSSTIEQGDQIVQNPREYPDFLRRLVSNHRARTAMKRFSPSKDENGELTQAAVTKMNEILGYEGISNLASVDQDRSETISISELSAFITKTQDVLVPLEDTTAVAAAGTETEKPELSEEEKDAAFKEQAEGFLAAFWSRMDKNSDDKIDSEELAGLGPQGARMKDYDKNKDGEITKEEAVAGIAEGLKKNQGNQAGGPPGGASSGGKPAAGGK